MTEPDTHQAETALAAADPLLGKLIARQKLQPRTVHEDYFVSLCQSIIGQQVSVAAATAIYGRFQTATGVEPARVSKIDETAAKLIGLSRQKTGYLRDLAAHFADNPHIYNHLGNQSDDQVITELTAIKGIGVWTAQMFLIFTLDRPDIFAVDDVGLQNAMRKLYGWEVLPPKKVLLAAAAAWAPYRSLASLHLWQSLNNTPAM